MDLYKLRELDNLEVFQIIENFFNKCKKDIIQHDIEIKKSGTLNISEHIKIHNALYDKQKRYANDLFNDLTHEIKP